MRKSAMILVAVVAIVVAALIYFTQNRYLERAIESAGEAVIGAKVEVENFDFSFFGLKCSWAHFQVANPNNPWRNLIETGKASFAIEGRPLFWGRVIIDEMILEEVRSGSKRKTDGSLPAVEPSENTFIGKATQTIESRIHELSELDFSSVAKTLKIDSLIDPNKLASVQKYNSLHQNIDSTFGLWDKQIKQQNYDEQIRTIRSEIATLRPDSIKNDVVAMAEAIKKLDGIRNQISVLKNDIENKRKALTDNFANIQNDLKDIQNVLQADIEMVKRRAKLQGLEAKDAALVLFGEPVVARIELILSYVEIGREYLPAAEALFASDQVESPPRFEGQDIHFPFHYTYPRFLVKKIRASGMTAAGDSSRGYALEGNIFGLTNEPPVFGKPTRFDLKFFREAGNHYAVRGAFDHVGKTAKDSIWISSDNIRLGRQKLKAGKYFPASLHAERGGVNLTGFFSGDALKINLGFHAAPVSFEYASETQDKIAKIVRDVLANVNKIQLDALVAGEKGNYALSMNSNIDNALSTGVMAALSSNLREAQSKLEAGIYDEVGKHKSAVEAKISHYKQTTFAEVETAQRKVQTELDKVNQYKKDLEARIEVEKKKAEKIIADEKSKLEEKAKTGLKSLLKKKKN